jgi:hypothetical protein
MHNIWCIAKRCSHQSGCVYNPILPVPCNLFWGHQHLCMSNNPLRNVSKLCSCLLLYDVSTSREPFCSSFHLTCSFHPCMSMNNHRFLQESSNQPQFCTRCNCTTLPRVLCQIFSGVCAKEETCCSPIVCVAADDGGDGPHSSNIS